MNVLKLRQRTFARIRRYFKQHDVMEVDTPQLRQFSVTDPYMLSMQAVNSQGLPCGYLQTSPEYAMKELLAFGSGDIFQLGKVFRSEERGPYHSEEFTLLEWYRLNFDHYQLMDDVFNLLASLYGKVQRCDYSYQDAFINFLGIDPFRIALPELKHYALTHLGEMPERMLFDNYLTLIFSQLVEPQFEKDKVTFVHSFPAAQASLAKIKTADYGDVACRFEVFMQGMELANGFYELTDASEQRRRFAQDNQVRKQLGYPEMPIDTGLIAALEKGLPDCAGVALGVDRLLMILSQSNDIQDVLPMALTIE